MPEQYLESISPIDFLTVGNPPHGTLSAFRYAPSVEAGKPVEMSFAITNTGDFAGSFYIDVWDTVEGTRVWQSTRFNLNPGEFRWIYSYDEPAPEPIMPNHDWGLTVQAHHDGEIDDPMITEIIPLLVVIATALSLDLIPSAVPKGGEYMYSGKLTNVDTGAGIPGMEIILYRNTGEVGRTITDGNGNYSSSAVAPTTVGDYPCYAEFVGAFSYEASLSPLRGLGVAIFRIPVAVPAIGAVLAGLGLVYLSSRK